LRSDLDAVREQWPQLGSVTDEKVAGGVADEIPHAQHWFCDDVRIVDRIVLRSF
jgi:hypothetical protein